MTLVRLTYTSTISEAFRLPDIKAILEAASKNNKLKHITGMLSFNRKFFLQCLEGERAAVNRIYHEITCDPRHEDFLILDYREIAQREFVSWSMGYLEDKEKIAELAVRYSAGSQFNPYELSAESAHRLLLAVRDHLQKK